MDKIELELNIDKFKYDDCNALVSTGKRKQQQQASEKSKKSKTKPVVLSKKKRKKLQKVLERKSKKINVSFIIFFVYECFINC